MLHDRQSSCRLRTPRDVPGGGRAVDRIPKMSVHAAYTCAQPMYTGAVLSHDRECGVPAGHTSHRESDASGRPCSFLSRRYITIAPVLSFRGSILVTVRFNQSSSEDMETGRERQMGAWEVGRRTHTEREEMTETERERR